MGANDVQAVTIHRPTKLAAPQGEWAVEAIQALLDKPLMDLLFEAQTVHRQHWPEGTIELATLLSVKTGGCPENCGYCPQAAEFDTGVKAEKLMAVDEVVRAAQAAKDAGATRFCMGAAWRAPKDRDIEKVAELIGAVKGLGLQTCATLGMLEAHQATALKDAGLDYYNHNLDTAPEYYTDVVSTRAYQDRLDTLQHVRSAGISVCCGGIVGMGEAPVHRAGLIAQLANLQPYPESVPINSLVRVPGTPLADSDPIDPFDFVRVIAVARITMPKARVRLSAGRQQMGDAVQALCFMAGANSIFYGDKLLVTGNPDVEADVQLLAKLGLNGHRTTSTEPHDLHDHAATRVVVQVAGVVPPLGQPVVRRVIGREHDRLRVVGGCRGRGRGRLDAQVDGRVRKDGPAAAASGEGRDEQQWQNAASDPRDPSQDRRRRPPVPAAEQAHRRRHEKGTDHGGVEGDGDRDSEPERLDEDDVRERERAGDEDDDQRGGRHDPATPLEAVRDGRPVVAGLPPRLLHPRQQEDLVVHR